MAKRKKPAPKVGARRTPRRGKQSDETNSVGGESSTSVEKNNDENPSEKSSGDSAISDVKDGPPTNLQVQKLSHTNLQPTVALHKKFGKYRCLFTNDDMFNRKYENCSDSETNSSVEIRVVDPNAGSESDSNAATEHQSDANSTNLSPLLKLNKTAGPTIPCSTMGSSNEFQTHDEDSKTNESNKQSSNELDDVNIIHGDATGIKESHNENHDVSLMSLEQQLEYGDDDEVITVVQIVEDDNQDYYNINIDTINQMQLESDYSETIVSTEKQEADIQNHFAKLNLLQIESNPNSPLSSSAMLESSTPPCMTPDLQNSNDTLMRPDPSLTPSSTLSDDSNSSRVAEQNTNNSNDSSESSPSGVRRSSRIKTITTMKQKTKGYGLVKTPLKKALITQTKLKLEEISVDAQEKQVDGLPSNTLSLLTFPIPSEMPVKVKSRWRRSSELEMGANSPAISPLASPSLPSKLPTLEESPKAFEEESSVAPLSKEAYEKIIEDRMNQYQHLDENDYLCERMISKDTKKMICDCFMTKEELERGELACGEDCLNRLLMIECNSRCPVGDRCTNRRFQKKELAPLKVFYADKKGCGVEASADISAGEFLMEYVGEVLDCDQFYKRAQAYSDDNNLHHYFMSLKGDTVIDATLKGNISRFINHSCEPNAETQKWTVNGELRIGFFSKRDILEGEEITFDYQFQRFGKVAQRCYCGAENCRGWIGAEPDSEDEDYEEEDEDVSTSKSETTESTEEALVSETGAEQPRPHVRKTKRERKYKAKTPELALDADIEEELEALARTGVKNQSHTLRLSRTVVRARARRTQMALLRLLRDADLPCRRLFLDYRGLRLLAPWASDAPLHFRLEMLLTVDRLPIPNKTMVQESRFFTIVERWLSSSEVPPPDPVFINESTGLSVELPNVTQQQNVPTGDKTKEHAAILQKVKDLSSQLLERWSSLKEVFKIPKKERIQQMKEHERQANVERRAADSSGSRDRERDRREDRDRDRDRDRERREERDRDRDRDRERDRERERDRDRDRERDRDRKRDRDRERDRDRDDRDRRKRRGSPDGRRSIRLNERVLAAVPPMSKEERRRAFAEAAAAAEQARRAPPAQPAPHPAWPQQQPFWPPELAQMFPQGMIGNAPNMMNNAPNMMSGAPNMMGGAPNMMSGPPNMMSGAPNMLGPMGPMSNMMPGVMPSDIPQEWIGPNGEYQGPPGFCPTFNGPQSFCMPQNMLGMGGFGMGGFMFGQQLGPPFQSLAPTDPNAASAEDGEEAVIELPSMWRSAVDGRGRRYYYHVKLRRPQWQPPVAALDEGSSEEEADELSALDTAIIQRKAKGKLVEGVNGIYEVIKEDSQNGLIPDHALLNIKSRKRRPGLVTERPISPRTEQDKLAGRLEVKRYRQTKEKLRRRRERLLQRARRLPPHREFVELDDSDTETEDSDEAADMEKTVPFSPPPAEPSPPPVAPPPPEPEDCSRRIKEQFRSNMARVMVQHLNPYRHSEAPKGRITSTADFKHLARKLTHFVMLKELKHCRSVEELVVTDSVRSKAKMFVRKYMAKFGRVYARPPDEHD